MIHGISQNEQTEFKKICLDAKEDENTLDLLREDHEQAEQEAALCRCVFGSRNLSKHAIYWT